MDDAAATEMEVEVIDLDLQGTQAVDAGAQVGDPGVQVDDSGAQVDDSGAEVDNLGAEVNDVDMQGCIRDPNNYHFTSL